MGQYYPTAKVSTTRYPEINRRVTPGELDRAFELAREAGLHRFDQRIAVRPA